MAEKENDPAATTQQFRAFAKGGGGAEARSKRMGPGLIIAVLAGLVVAMLVIAAVLMNA